MHTVFSKKRFTGLVAAGVVSGLAISAIAYAAVTFGPSRPTFTWAHPARYVTFNSITDNPQWGDERYLIKARDVNAGTNTYNTTQQVKDNQEMLVTVFFHDNADSSLNLTATGTHAKITLPSGANTTAEVRGDISADNANPTNVFSTMDFVSTNGQPITLEYVKGSARLITNYVNMSLSDSVVGSGTTIGTSGTDGKVPGCSQFSGYVTVHVKVHTQTTPTPTPTPSPTPAPKVESQTTTLPNTGAGGVIGLFAGATVLATAGHYLVRRARRA